ncbi:flagellar biosynthesis anti-sigma factor FlgM [Robertmurraya sp. Marseille-Q9965]
MKINNYGTSGINPYKSQMNKLENTNKASKQTDKVEISATAKEMQQIKNFNAQRQEKVEALKIQVETGNYKVNTKEVAKSLYNFYRN